jgi:anti-sigma factor RsiW
MKCRKAQKTFSAYQDRELKPGEQEQVRRHLWVCRDCREQYAELDRILQALGKLGEIRPDPWFYRQLARKIKESREKGFLPTLRYVLQLFRAPVTVSIILAIGLLAGTYLGGILARFDLLPFQTNLASYSQEALFTSMRVFDPTPSGTFAGGYLRMVSYRENESR